MFVRRIALKLGIVRRVLIREISGKAKKKVALKSDLTDQKTGVESTYIIGPGSQRAPIHEYYEESKLVYGDLLVGKKMKPSFIKKIDKAINSKEWQFVLQQQHEYDVTNYLLFGPRLKTLPEEFRSAGQKISRKMDVEQILYNGDLDEPANSSDLFVDAWNCMPQMPAVTPVKRPTAAVLKSTAKAQNLASKDSESSTLSRTNPKSIVEDENIVKVPLFAKSLLTQEVKSSSISNQNSPPVILIKTEGDLKALGRAPLLNPTRPNYSIDPNTVSPPVNLLFKICPEDLTTLTLTPEQYPSVSAVLNATQSPESRARLEAWKQKMINDLGQEGFEKYQEALFSDGKSFHTAVETVLRGTDPKDVNVPERNVAQWRSVKEIFKEISDVICVEEKVCHPYLCYKGVTDGVIWLDGKLCLVDWKTSGSRKDTAAALYDNPIQVAAYIGAINFDEKFAARSLQVETGAVVVAYNTGEPASVIRFDLKFMRPYWTQWLRRLQQYWRMVAMDKAMPKRS